MAVFYGPYGGFSSEGGMSFASAAICQTSGTTYATNQTLYWQGATPPLFDWGPGLGGYFYTSPLSSDVWIPGYPGTYVFVVPDYNLTPLTTYYIVRNSDGLIMDYGYCYY